VGDDITKVHPGGPLYRCAPIKLRWIQMKESYQMTSLTELHTIVETSQLQRYPSYASCFVYHHGRQSKSITDAIQVE
jgi:hypothetical protein